MGKQYVVDEKLVLFANQIVRNSSSADDIKRGLCVLLPFKREFTTDEVADLLQINRRTVFRYRDELKSLMYGEEDPRDNWGGRRNSLLPTDEEADFLSQWEAKAIKGELIDAKVIHNALVDLVKRPVALATTYNILKRNSWRKVQPNTCHPKSDPAARDELKKMPEFLDALCKEMNNLNLPLAVLFQDEARFGRMCIPVSCWAPSPFRPIVTRAIERQFNYVYSSVYPKVGKLFYMVKEKMNTQNMSLHLRQISQRLESNFIILIVDGASSHTSKHLKIPTNMAILKLPPYSPELNPTEQIWRMLRGDYFGNRTFDSLRDAINQARFGLRAMASDKESITQLTYWPWISDAISAFGKKCHNR